MIEPPPHVAIVSLGCPKNLVDSERLCALLAEGGCLVGAPLDDADVIVVNTCGFIAPAVEESLGVIDEAIEAKRGGRARRVVVAGCLATREGEDLLARRPEIDAVVGVHDRETILDAVTGGERTVRLSPCPPAAVGDAGRFRLTPPHTAFLRIAEGCSRRCTFCTIPAIRGPYRSKPPETVLAEARELLGDGAVELNVIAQDTTAYGADLPGQPAPADLLRELDALGPAWVRLMYAYPQGFSDELIAAIADAESVVPYLDMPLQHIADPVLKRMGRQVTRDEIERLLDRLSERIDGLVLRTTFITGFPGETEADFEELLAFVQARRFDAVGVFPYSPEPDTPAARLHAPVPVELAEQRRERIMLAQQAIAFAEADGLIGSRACVLVDGRAGEVCAARHYGQAPEVDSICILTAPAETGTFVEGTIVGREGYDLLVRPHAAG